MARFRVSAVLSRPRLAALAIPFVLAAGLVSGCGKTAEGPALVTTGSRRMTVEDFKAYAREPQVMQQYAALPESAQKRALLDDLLSYELMAEAAHREGLDKDTTYTGMDKRLLPTMLPDALYEKHVGELVKVSESEAKIFYEQQKKEYRIAVIMTVDPKDMPERLERLARGEKFADVAKSSSEDPTTAPNGGEIPGWVMLGQLPPAIETAVAPLTAGKHTGAIPQRTGTYVFEVLEVREKKDLRPFPEAKADAISMLENRKRAALVDSYLETLKKSYHLDLDGPGMAFVQEKLLGMPDSLLRKVAKDPASAGLTARDMGEKVASWGTRTYTVTDYVKDVLDTHPSERPSPEHVYTARMYVEGKAVSDILVVEAKKEHLDESPKVKRNLERARSAYLVNQYVEKKVPNDLTPPSPAVLDSLTKVLVASMGQAAPPNLTFSALPPQVQQQIQQGYYQTKRRAQLEAEVARLKAEIKPVVNEELLKTIPWPVPAADSKENA